jgi:hypothetical protein
MVYTVNCLDRKHHALGALVELVDRWMEEGRVPTQWIVMITPALE